jgi:hypothetical protein
MEQQGKPIRPKKSNIQPIIEKEYRDKTVVAGVLSLLGALWGRDVRLFGSACFERGGARMALQHMIRYLSYLSLLGIAMLLRHMVRYLSIAAL